MSRVGNGSLPGLAVDPLPFHRMVKGSQRVLSKGWCMAGLCVHLTKNNSLTFDLHNIFTSVTSKLSTGHTIHAIQ